MILSSTAGRRRRPFHRPHIVAAATGLTVALALGGCSTPGTTASPPDSAAASFFDDSLVHTISVQFSDEDYQAMLAAYADSGDKDWISATVTIDGSTLENVGLRLKGNSSLQSLSGKGEPQPSGDGGGTAESPETLPWLIRTDKYVDGQQYQGRTDLVVRGNNSESSLNEALALELTGAAHLATLEAAAARFSVNGGREALRLVIESPDDEFWNADTFGEDGSIYKAESGGDYSYRGDNAEDYTDVFEQKAGADDLQPLTAFLEFINTSSDADFTAKLGEFLDIEAFATYLAAQDLMGNMDDIDGPGNNSYLRYDSETGLMTVVTWDLNLTFGGMPGGEGTPDDSGMPLPDGVPAPPEGMEPPAGFGPGGSGGQGGSGGPGLKENALAARFMASSDFEALYESALTTLRTDLYASGEAQQILDKWSVLLSVQATDLVSAETIAEEAAGIAAFFAADPGSQGS